MPGVDATAARCAARLVLIDLELSRHRHDRGGMNAAKAIAECLRHLAGHRSRAR
ncbi:hypothetical protein RZR06_15645 [Bradyrhizobium diazoefficiens]|uniref:hypothetical protein n=1 Tax=Bradyrhizobium diazoefficiens TaxID=1355477 RepID=UPI002B45C082|nr:hypothetical protein [Bradyrhizobium diazoefficiens]WRJ01542.1 hypothetical protein RZR06_15645 [Bradyrhizobium diazoefficiens]